MRFLLVNNHCISDPIAGVTQSLRTIVEWLADAGHECHVLTTARFESSVTFTIEEHLAEQGVARAALVDAPSRRRRSAAAARAADRPVVRYAVRQVPVTLLLTRHNDESRPDRAEASAVSCPTRPPARLEHAPDVLIAANGHPMIFEALRDARRRGITTAFAVRGFGYYEPSYFADVNHVFTCSRFLTGVYREKIGLVSTPLEPPLDWSTVVAPVDSRAFVTFVESRAAQGPVPVRAAGRHARLATARHPGAPGRRGRARPNVTSPPRPGGSRTSLPSGNG